MIERNPSPLILIVYIVFFKAFEVLVAAVEQGRAGHPHPILTLIMHKLTRRNTSANAVHALLQMLPKFGSDRTCLGTVLRIILGLGAR